MRGRSSDQMTMLTLRTPEQRVPKVHPLRSIKAVADEVLKMLSRDFDGMYSKMGRSSIPPERILKASILMALYTVRSERLFCEQLDYNLLFRWFLDMDMVEPGFDHSTFSKNRERLLDHHIAEKFFIGVVEGARAAGLLSSEHFTVDGTLIEAWASMKSFRPKSEKPEDREPPDDPGNPTVNFHGQKRRNDTHASTTDPEAKLAKKGKGKEAKLSFAAHALMENRNGLLVDFRVTEANGYAEREAALAMMKDNITVSRRATVGADAGYDVAGFVDACRSQNVTPHVAPHRNGYSAVDGRTKRHPGYEISQRVRKRIEEIFGWMKTVGNFRKTRYRGVERTQHAAFLLGAAYNLMRMARLAPNLC